MKVAILGAGGHARTLINLLELNQVEIEGIYDDNFDSGQEEFIEGHLLKGAYHAVPKKIKVVIAKGKPIDIIALSNRFNAQLLNDNIIHPKAIIETENMNLRNQVSAQVYVSKTATIGIQNIIYSGTNVEHEAVIGDNNVVTVNVAICGRVKIGNECFLGASSTILPGISICDKVIIGAGAVVLKDINSNTTFVGNPAKQI